MPRKKKYQIKRLKRPKLHLSPETKKDIFVVFLLAVGVFSLLSLFGLTGTVGQAINKFWGMLTGWVWWIWPFVLILVGWLLINKERYEIKAGRWVGLILFILTLSGVLGLFVKDKTFEAAQLGGGGGIIGYVVAMPLEKLASFWGALIIIIALLIISLLMFFETSINAVLEKFHLPEIHFFSFLKQKMRRHKEDYDEQDVGFEQRDIDAGDMDEDEEDENDDEKQKGLFPKSKKFYPLIDIPIDLLNGKMSKPTSGDIKANQEIIKRTLNHFGLDVDMADVSVGPTVTQYTFKPASGVKVSQITTLNNDLALALAAHPIRIEAPIPGKSLIGIEVPNQKIATVSLKEVLTTNEFKKRQSSLMMVLGKDVAGKPWLANLDKMPHLLVAGATGSGKTVCLNAIITSLLYENQPSDLKFILIDPKRVEMPQYNGIPHLICPVITDVKKTVNALRWAVKEMDRRFEVLSNAGKRNITAYNASNPKERMPYLVIIVDELADLMAVAAAEVEQAVIRLAQMARAVGIHLVLATQKPSVNVITGLIKSNITSRIAFSVASLTDSRTILDHSGAEKLLGRGDMLFISAELSKPKRLQGAYVSDDEIERVVKYLKSKGEPDYVEEITQAQTSFISNRVSGFDASFGDDDELLPEAKELVIKAGKASASYLQRRFRIGYARAARLLDLLEEQGVVGPAEGAKPREILMRSTDDLEYDTDNLEKAHQELREQESEIKEEDESEELEEENDDYEKTRN